MSNINIPMKIPFATFYLWAIAIFVISVTVCEMLSVEICMTLTLTLRIGQHVNMPMKRPHSTFYLLAMFVLSDTFCEIITYELPKFESLNLKIKVKDVDDSDRNRNANVPSQYPYVQNGATRSSPDFAIHNRRFREGRTIERKYSPLG